MPRNPLPIIDQLSSIDTQKKEATTFSERGGEGGVQRGKVRRGEFEGGRGRMERVRR